MRLKCPNCGREFTTHNEKPTAFCRDCGHIAYAVKKPKKKEPKDGL